MFENSLVWFGKATNDYNNKLQHKEKWGLKDNIIINNINEGELMGTLDINVKQMLNQVLIGFDVFVYSKDGKYKYDFTNYKYINNAMMSGFAGHDVNLVNNLEGFDINRNKRLMQLIYDESIELVSDLKKQMSIRNLSPDF